jgi:hypothetical protein
MSDDSNILIQIKSTFERSGAVEAEAAQKRLESATKPVAESFAKSEREIQKSRQALAGLNSVAAAGQGSWMGLTRSLEAFGGRLADIAAKGSMVVGALSAGYALGTAIDKWFGISDAISKSIVSAEKYVSVQDRIKKQLGDIDKTTLAAVTAQFDKLSDSLSSTLSQMEKINAVRNQLMGLETEAQISEMEAGTPPGPARDKALLAKRQERDLASIEERRNQARAKLATAEEARKSGEAAVWTAESSEGDARKTFMLLNQNPSASLEAKAEARQRLQIAERASAAARASMSPLNETYGNTMADTSNTMRGLSFEERTVRARTAGGMSSIAREEEQRRAGIRDNLSSDMLSISRNATRSAMLSRRDELASQAANLRESALPAARVNDLRTQAAGAAKQADSAVAAVSAVLSQITAQLKALEDKIHNLPR